MGNLNVRKPFPMELHLKAKSIELKSETFTYLTLNQSWHVK